MVHIRPDGLTDCDFCQPPEEERLDNIAGAVAACGLLELAKLTGNQTYHEAALRLVDGLLTHCCDWSADRLGLLTHCTASYHDDGAGPAHQHHLRGLFPGGSSGQAHRTGPHALAVNAAPEPYQAPGLFPQNLHMGWQT